MALNDLIERAVRDIEDHSAHNSPMRANAKQLRREWDNYNSGQFDETYQLRCDLAKMTNERDLLVDDARMMRDLKREIRGFESGIQVKAVGFWGMGDARILGLARIWREIQLSANMGQ